MLEWTSSYYLISINTSGWITLIKNLRSSGFFKTRRKFRDVSNCYWSKEVRTLCQRIGMTCNHLLESRHIRGWQLMTSCLDQIMKSSPVCWQTKCGPNYEEFTSLLPNKMWTKHFENLNSGERHSQFCKISLLFVIPLVINSMTNIATDASQNGKSRGTC